VARSGSVEHELRIKDILVAVGVERAHAHAATELSVNHVDGAADADEQVAGTESVEDGRKDDALFDVVFSSGRVEKRHHVVINWPQGVLDVIERKGIGVEGRADEIVEAPLHLDQEGQCRMQRDAPFGIARRSVQICRHLCDERDGPRAVQDARRGAAAKGGVDGLERRVHDALRVETSGCSKPHRASCSSAASSSTAVAMIAPAARMRSWVSI